MPRRRELREKVKWTNKMIDDAIKCKEKALTLVKSSEAPRRNGRKIGYMELMLDFWNKEGYDSLNLTKQNLSDEISQALKRKHGNPNSARPLAEIILSEQENICDETSDVNIRNDIVVNPNINTSPIIKVVGDKSIPEILTKATNIFIDISRDVGNYSARMWRTKLKNTPTNESVEIINTVCHKLIETHVNNTDVLINLWLINCIVYSTVVAFLLVNGVKNIVIKSRSSENLNGEPKWVVKLKGEIKQTRRFISQCDAERKRLTKNGRLTRRTRRNREEMLKCLKDGVTLSCTSITILIEKSKSKLKRLAKSLKRKLKNAEASKMNREFKTNQKNVYANFKQILDECAVDAEPVYKKVKKKASQVFENAQDVVDFWAGIWEKTDSGNPNAQWISDIEKAFREIVPVTNCNRIPIVYTDIHKSIRKKKNWSAPGPDLIVNFWWKKLTATHLWITNIVDQIVNDDVYPGVWFSLGRVTLIPKDDEWSAANQRPITCTNNIYKWYTSVLLLHSNKHLDDNNLMQIDQRGAKSNCSGTTDNLLLDDTIIRDAIMHKRNLSCAWLDVRKAFDSLSHSYLKRIIAIHQMPLKLVKALWTVMDNWFVQIDIPTAQGVIQSRLIHFSNGELQGDSLGPLLYTLAKNPISWVLRQQEGYVLSAPIKEKVTHALFVDDLKKYDGSVPALGRNLQITRNMMGDAGLGWNEKKCKCAHLKRGKMFIEDLTLEDGFKLKCLDSLDLYKYLGVPECVVHDIPNLCVKIMNSISGRANVTWSSPLSDYNKITTTNTFVNSTAEYFFWSEKFRLEDLKKMDICVREAMVKNGAKHYQQLNSLLYLPKRMGGRGLRSLENTYKETKIKAAIKLLDTTDKRIMLVTKFNRNCLRSNHASIFKDAIKYASELDLKLEIEDNSYSVTFEKEQETICTDSYNVIKGQITQKRNEKLESEVFKSTWQGLNFKARKDDETLQQGCYDWLKTWKNVPSNIVRDIYDLYCQTLSTKTFQLIRSECAPTDTVCRLCKSGNESVKHILNGCEKLLKGPYTRRHDQALKCFFNELLMKCGFISECPPWFSQIKVKPYYDNDDASIWWNIPEFTGATTDDEERIFRPDGKVMLKHAKKIFLIEITISGIDIRQIRYEEKNQKYEAIRRNIMREEPEYTVDQITLVMDSLGGYSKNLCDNIGKVFQDAKIIQRIIHKMQKSVLSGSVHISRCFKLETQV